MNDAPSPPPASLDGTNDRKIQHIEILHEDRATDRRKYYFDDLRLTHRALPEIALEDVDPSTTFLGKHLSFPLLISCMTGGSHERVVTINRRLAEAAEAEQVVMGTGSMRVMFSAPEARASFALRDAAPTAVLLGNLGAVQLNEGFGLDQAREAVAILAADALVLHLNPLQEAVQPEGDTNFRNLAAKIGEIGRGLAPTPVIVKEVGAGLSPADATLLLDQGIRFLDVAGSGGTSWSRIEHHRHTNPTADALGLTFQDWGLPTPLALMMLEPFRDRTTLIASGGIRTGIDMVKSVLLGASLAGLARPFLDAAEVSTEDVRRVIQRLRREFITAMFLLGVQKLPDLIGRKDLLVLNPWQR